MHKHDKTIEWYKRQLEIANQQIEQLTISRKIRKNGETFDLSKVNRVIYNLIDRIIDGTTSNSKIRNDYWYDYLNSWHDESIVEHSNDYYLDRSKNMIDKLTNQKMLEIHNVTDIDAVEQLLYILDFIKKTNFKQVDYTPRRFHTGCNGHGDYY